MAAAFRDAFAEGATRVVIIGSDCPWLSASDIEAAWDGLSKYDVVLGPAADGGYWLIALKRLHTNLFQRIHWGTHTVLDETTRAARRASLRVLALRLLEDIDTPEQWLAYTFG
jgi:glycosyltransferase A (GT-A) superfamily protein (DUF2064 family)